MKLNNKLFPALSKQPFQQLLTEGLILLNALFLYSKREWSYKICHEKVLSELTRDQVIEEETKHETSRPSLVTKQTTKERSPKASSNRIQ